jgi:hypothetical protein
MILEENSHDSNNSDYELAVTVYKSDKIEQSWLVYIYM